MAPTLPPQIVLEIWALDGEEFRGKSFSTKLGFTCIGFRKTRAGKSAGMDNHDGEKEASGRGL